jgi:hypothetical protein
MLTQLVAILWRHEHIAAAHDAELKRESKWGITFVGVDEVDDVPPCFADNGQVRLRGIMRERRQRDLKFHVEDTRVLDLWWPTR